MEILINGQLAVLKKNTSFEYICENSMFTGSDSYTLTITFPLKDCPQNIRIFGHIHRQDVEKSKIVFDCEIRDRSFYKAGIITITQISEVEVKTQFLEGMSEQNFDDTFDDIYINELNLGYGSVLSKSNNMPYDFWAYNDENPTYVALPWVNNTSGLLHNEVTFDTSVYNYKWASTRENISYQPYLLYILNKICEQIGYSGDFSSIKQTVYRYLLICNTLPPSWGARNFSIALPHWSLTEFFEQLGLFLSGQFTINHKAKSISFQFNKNIAASTADVKIEQVLDKYTVEVAKDSQSDYLGYSNLAYAGNDNRLWTYRSCQWFIDEYKDKAIVYDSFFELRDYAQTLATSGVYTRSRGGKLYSRGYPNTSDGHKLFYARDMDTYFVMWCYKAVEVDSHKWANGETSHWYQYYNRLEPINQFGEYIVDKDAEQIELGFVPAWIDETDEELGACLFLECGNMGDAEEWTVETSEDGNTTVTGSGSFGGSRSTGTSSGLSGRNTSDLTDEDYNNGALAQPNSVNMIAKGEQEKNSAYFDCIYMGYWDQENRNFGFLPRPVIDYIEIKKQFNFVFSPYSMRLADMRTAASGIQHNIDVKKKYNFSFLTDEIPDPRAVFYIEGGKYVCEKLACTFNESTGRSKLIKGSFFRIEDD